jgi:5,10-methylenetetrahydromethanopterin reductase
VDQVTSVRTGVWFQGGLSVKRAVELARAAEDAGVDAVWVAEGPIGRDAFVTLTAIAAATSRVELGTGVVNSFTRHPAQIAASFATLDEASDGRAVAGLGIGARDYLTPLGFDTSKPIATAREMLELMRRLLAREVIDHAGVKFRLEGARLAFEPPRADIPIYLAATGPRMSALAGELADGIYLLFGTREYVENVLRNARKDRPADKPLEVASPIFMAVDEDRDAARAQVKTGIGLVLTEPSGEAMLEANGLDPAHAERIRAALAESGVRALRSAVDDAIVDSLTIVGTPAECVARLEEAVSWGITHPLVLLSGDDPAPALGVLRELRRAAA